LKNILVRSTSSRIASSFFSEKSALTLLRSALGGERVKGHRERRVSYSITGSRARVLEHYFFGAINIHKQSTC